MSLAKLVPPLVFILLTACASKSESVPETLRHSWGDPNLQGSWDYRTATPLVAPQAMGDRIYFTDAEKRDFERQSTARGIAFVRKVGNYVGDEPWADRGLFLTENNRATLITHPANGRLPGRTELGKKMS